jgi:hypothetical protein
MQRENLPSRRARNVARGGRNRANPDELTKIRHLQSLQAALPPSKRVAHGIDFAQRPNNAGAIVTQNGLQKVAYAALLLLLLGVCSGYLGGL